jgi:hypothetical protein
MTKRDGEHDESDDDRLRVQRVSLGLPLMRASATFSETLVRALSLSVLGFSVDLARRPPPDQRNIDRALKALSEASVLVADLEHDLMRRTQDLMDLKEQYEHFERLANIERDAARDVIAEIEASVGRGRPKERWIALVINLIAGLIIFGFGIAVQRYLLPG